MVINLWEETVWAGFFETRLENRFNIFIAGVLTAVPSAGVHMPLLLIGDHTSALSILKGIALKGIARLVLGVVVRLMIGVVMRAAADNVLAVGICIRSSTAAITMGPSSTPPLDDADGGR